MEEVEAKGRRSRLTVFSQEYYAVCAFGGMLSAGTTHLAITPLDVLKVNMQVNPVKYNGIFSGLHTLVKEQGPSSLWRGWSGKLFGYGVQVLLLKSWQILLFVPSKPSKFVSKLNLTSLEVWLMACQNCMPMKAFLVSMLMFSTFEHSVDFLYRKIIQRKREKCSRAQQLGVTCVAGYTSGIIGVIISTPADNIISSLYNKKTHNVLQAVRSIGFPMLFTRSLPIRIALVGPVVTLQWFLYDSIKLLTGLPTSGGIMTDKD